MSKLSPMRFLVERGHTTNGLAMSRKQFASLLTEYSNILIQSDKLRQKNLKPKQQPIPVDEKLQRLQVEIETLQDKQSLMNTTIVELKREVKRLRGVITSLANKCSKALGEIC